MTRLQRLAEALNQVLPEGLAAITTDLDEITLDVRASDYISVALLLRDSEALSFEQLIDLCGVDYAGYGGAYVPPLRFATVTHLLSVRHNWRVRLRVFSDDDAFPLLASVCDVWPAASWFEREAFDMFGIMYEGHPDLRRILTDYGFVGHPFRKDFPVSGFMEMIYDKEQGRVVYQPVSIEPRENTPRIVREETYGGGRG
jgi:NADH-quinone oxidoreductase subunit C